MLTPKGAYAKLVEAQRLREEQELPMLDVSHEIQRQELLMAGRTIMFLPKNERNCCFTNSTKGGDGEEGKSYSMFYLFRRMGSINRKSWRLYVFGLSQLFAQAASTLPSALFTLGL